MNFKKTTFEKLKRITSFLITPIQEQAPFFIMWCLLMGNETIRAWNGTMCLEPGISFFSYPCRLCIVFLQAWVLAFVINKVNWRLVKALFYLLLFIPCIVTTYLKTDQGCLLNPTVLSLMLETNWHESSDFFNLYICNKTGVKILLIVAILIGFVILFECYRLKIKATLSKKMISRLLRWFTPLAMLIGTASSYTYIELLNCSDSDEVSKWYELDFVRPHDSYSLLLYSIYDLHLASQQTKTCIRKSKETINKKFIFSQEEKDSLFVVVVIGESFIRSHSSLYGYALQTSPELTKERNSGNLIVFNDVISPWPKTSPTIRNVLCTNSIIDGEKWYNTPYFPAIFKQSGFHVQFWDNQVAAFGKHQPFSFALNSLLLDKDIQDISYNGTNGDSRKFDHELFEDYIQNEPKQGVRNLILFHLNGQHADASTRYPHQEEFRRFTADSIKTDKPWIGEKERTAIAEYDNCTVYNDHVLSMIFNFYRERNAIILYFSDHGGMMYEQPGVLDRKLTYDASRETLEPLFRIPFVIWMSDKFKSSHPEHYDATFEARNKPFMIDNLCQILFHVSGLNNPWYKQERDILSKAYKVRDRIVGGKTNFDSIVPKLKPMP